MAKRYERTLFVFFKCLSLGFFLILIQLLIQPFIIVGIVTFPLILIGSVIHIVRTFYFENKTEIFDLTAPTIFDNGLMTFHSQREQSAVFFSFNLSSNWVDETTAQRALTVLLKILPTSTVLSLEWSTQNECFVNFYIKFEKTAFPTQARELLENITNSFNKMLRNRQIRALNGEEMMRHFSMGVVGRIGKISAKGKYLDLHTEAARAKRFTAFVSPANNNTLTHVLEHSNRSNFMRLFFPMKKAEKNLQMSDYLIIISDVEFKHSNSLTRTDDISIINLPALNSIRIFGDILTRNLIHDNTKTSNFQDTVTQILEFVSATHTQQQDMLQTEAIPAADFQIINSKMWRENLIQLSSQIDLPIEIDAQILVDEIPIRFDGKVGCLLFFIISRTKNTHLKWLIKNLMKFLKDDNQAKIIFLLNQPLQKPVVEELLSDSSITDRIQVISTKDELKLILSDYKKRVLEELELLAQVS